jgi:multiple sugar transport system substrate-binding protein
MMIGSTNGLGRRGLLAGSAALGAALTATRGQAQSSGAVSFTAWSAAVDQVKSHITAFEKASGVKVNYENFPWAQYRTSVVTRLVGNAPMDVLWVSDAWLPEFAEAGWLASIDDVPQLMRTTPRRRPTARSRWYTRQAVRPVLLRRPHELHVQHGAAAEAPASQHRRRPGTRSCSRRCKHQAAGHLRVSAAALTRDRHLADRVRQRDDLCSSAAAFTDDQGDAAVMADAARGAVSRRPLPRRDPQHKIVSPGAVETTEINGAARDRRRGRPSPSCRPIVIRALNDPSQARRRARSASR